MKKADTPFLGLSTGFTPHHPSRYPRYGTTLFTGKHLTFIYLHREKLCELDVAARYARK